MLTSRQILDTVNALGPPGIRGRVETLRRANIDGIRSDLTPSQAKFLDAAANTDVQQQRQGYAHPAAGVPSTAAVRGDKPLSPSELAWLQRLPADPSAVSYDDARRVFTLLNAVSGADDKALVEGGASVRRVDDWPSDGLLR